jgi:hypothetical protein
MNHRAAARLMSVRFPLVPAEGETLLSYALRVGAHNLHPSPLELLSTFRRGDKITTLWGLDPEVLSKIYRQPKEDLAPLLARPMGDGCLSIGERTIDARDLMRSNRRVSPAGLRKSAADRCDWAIRPLTFCPTNWDVLLYACPNVECRQRLTWRTCSIFKCGVCGQDLRQAPSTTIKNADRQILQILPDLLSAREEVASRARAMFPTGLASLPVRDLIDVVQVVGRSLLAASNPRSGSKRVDYPHEWIVGAENLTNPDFIQSVMSGKQPAHYTPLTREVKRRINGLSAAGSVALREFLDPAYHLLPELSGKFVSVTSAAARLRVDRSTVRKLIALGHLEVFASASEVGKQRKRGLISLNSVAAISDDRASISSLSAAFKIPKAVLLNLTGMGALEQLSHPAFPTIYSEVQLSALHSRTLLSTMIDRIEERSRNVADGERVSARALLDGLGGGDHLWANLLWKDLNDRLRHGLTKMPGAAFQLDQLMLHSSDAQAILDGSIDLSPEALSRSTVIRLKDAEKRLAACPRDIQALIRKGKLVRCGAGVSEASVQAVAKQFISTRELGRLTSVDPFSVSLLAAKRGLPRLWPRVGIWERAAAMSAFADLLGVDAKERAA